MTERLRGFSQLLSFFRSTTTWVVAGIAAAPLLASLAKIAPPWPPGILVITALVQILVLALVYMLFFRRRMHGIAFVTALGVVLLLGAGAVYLHTFYTYTYEVPTTKERFVKGTKCTPKAEQVYPTECPNVSDASIKEARYEAATIWESSSIDAVQRRLVALWIGAFAGLALALGTFYTYLVAPQPVARLKPRKYPHPYPNTRGFPHIGIPTAEVEPAPEVELEAAAGSEPPPSQAGMFPDEQSSGDHEYEQSPAFGNGEAPIEPVRQDGVEYVEDRVAYSLPYPPEIFPPGSPQEIFEPDIDPPLEVSDLPTYQHGKLLGDIVAGDALKPPPGPPSRWINAQLDDYDAGRPLVVGTTYTLAFGIDAAIKTNLGLQGAAPFVAPPAPEEYALTVTIDSEDFQLGDQTSRPLRIAKSGLSSGRARFDITPLHDGPSRLTASFLKDGNFVQKMELNLTVGGDAAPVAEISRLGRTLTNLGELRKRNLTIAIEAEGRSFVCRYWGPNQAKARLPITVDELADAIKQLRDALMEVVEREEPDSVFPFQDTLDIPPGESDLALLRLATAGYSLYRLLFFHPESDGQCHDMGHWLRKQALDPKAVLKIQIVGTNFAVPWALLYLAEDWDETKLNWECFLGMHHIVEQIPLQNEMYTADCAIEETSSGLAVSLNLNLSIDQQMGMNVVDRQSQYWQQVSMVKPSVRVTTRSSSGQVLTALGPPTADDQILYFYCHATAVGLGQPGGPSASSLTFTGNQSLTLQQLGFKASTDYKLAGNPFVFLNACESAELSPIFYNGFVPYFMSKGARGVLGTECKMPALFAVEWADKFFDELLAGKAVGQIVLDLRRHFYEKHGNPLGLLYGLHCNADTQILPTK